MTDFLVLAESVSVPRRIRITKAVHGRVNVYALRELRLNGLIKDFEITHSSANDITVVSIIIELTVDSEWL